MVNSDSIALKPASHVNRNSANANEGEDNQRSTNSMSGLMKSSTKLIPGSYARTLINALGIAQFSDHLNEDAYASPMLRNVLTALLASKGGSVSMPSQISASPFP